MSEILSRYGQDERLNICGLEGGSFACLASMLWIARKKPAVIAVAGDAEAAALQEDIRYYARSNEPGSIAIFPAPSSLPYTHLIPQADTWIERLRVLHTVENEGAPLVIAPIDALLRKVPPKGVYYDHIAYLSIGKKIARENFLSSLVSAGYTNSPLVEEEGDFAARGYIIDIFSPAHERPVRIELDGFDVASIRSFDPETQRTSFSMDSVTIVPVRSVMLDDRVVEEGLARLKKAADDAGISPVERRDYAASVRSGIYPAYTETLLPVFHPDSIFLLDYLGVDADVIVVNPAGIREQYQKFWNELNAAYAGAGHIEKAVSPADLYMEYDAWQESLQGRRVITINELEIDSIPFEDTCHPCPPLSRRVNSSRDPVQLSSLDSCSPIGVGDKFRRNDKRLATASKGEREMTLANSIRLHTSRPASPSGRWVEGSSPSSLNNFIASLRQWDEEGNRIVIACHTEVAADRLIDLLRWQGLAPAASDRPFTEISPPLPLVVPRASEASRGGERVSPPATRAERYSGAGLVHPALAREARRAGGSSPIVTIAPLSQGFAWPGERLVVLTEGEVFGKERRRVIHAPHFPVKSFASYQDLTEGDSLVHVQHGVGRYRGMIQMEFSGMRNDFLQIEYLAGDKLYVPAYRLNLIQKYIGPGDSAPFLDRLGGSKWGKARLSADRAVRRMASELLRIYAARKVKPGFAFSGRDHLMEEFEAAFPYDETPDQMQAIEDVLKDMAEPYPSDRLICGDVGYGKTEVAMRAAFKAAMDGKQAAVLVPTTILAFQHFTTFKDRFKNTPITIELLNRFISAKKQKEVARGLGNGQVDIVIGTHRLIQKDITYRDLGLLIIDEEHRFGVRQKEAIKKLKSTVDVVSMSATPIPRTLNISLVGARDISVINTPPADRRAIRTYVAEFDEGLVRGGILKELQRGGQVFFVHNRVQTIESMARRLAGIVPEAKIAVAHGQMKEHQLERVMVAFLRREYDVLLTTTIIESGLDIRNANTLIVNRADTFGLSELYQLRGRVGRSNVQAYAYLLIPDAASITAVATKRLAALQKFTELGSGFQIAMHDLEIRGSGNILGAEQSGHMSAIGYELYTELLEKEIRKLSGEKEQVAIDTEIQIPVEAYLPNTYIEDDGTRIVFYKRISAVKNIAEIDEAGRELADRFGFLPEVAKNLLRIMEVKIRSSALGIEALQYKNGVFVYKFSGTTPLSPQKILEFVDRNQEKMKFKPVSSLVIRESAASGADLFPRIRAHLASLEEL